MKWSPGPLPALLAATLVLAGGAFLVLHDPEPGYADRLHAICQNSEDKLAASSGNYFESVVLISSLKHTDLMQLEPPPEHAVLHRELERRERVMFEQAAAAQDRAAQAMALGTTDGAMADFETLRAAQVELDGWYRTLGIEGCSD